MFHLIVLEPGPVVDVVGVQEQLSVHAVNWYRFAPASWIVVSEHNAQWWSDFIAQFMPANGNRFVCQLAIHDRQGWMNQKFWTWLNQQQL